MLLGIFSSNAVAQSPKSNDKSFDQLVYSKIDYNRLPNEVKQQINKNKLAGVSLFEGVCRSFIADISDINTSSDIAKKLSFLFSLPNLRNVKHLSGSRVQIIASIDTEASFFKDLFLTNQVNANFIEQKFLVCN